MSRRRSRRLAVAACAVGGTLVAAMGVLAALLALGPSYPSGTSFTDGSSLADLVMTLAFAVVGSIVTLKRPLNLVGWALWVSGVGLLVGGVLEAYGELAVLSRPKWGLPGGIEAAELSAGSWTPLMAGVFLLFLTFPEGSLASQRARRFAVAVLSGFGFAWLGISMSAGTLDPPFEAYTNPLAPVDSKATFAVVIPVIAACLVSVVAAGVMALLRFRRSRGLERQQFKWLATSAGLLLVTLPFSAAFNYSAIAGAVFSAELIALPVSVGIAVLRYRLYELDRLVSKTLVYGALTVILGAAYAGLVLAGQAVFSSFAGGSNLAIAVSTLVVAALFLPLRSRVQRGVDRRFYRRRYDAARTLERFGARLREQVELDRLRGDLQDVVRETMEPAHVSLWLRRGAP